MPSKHSSNSNPENSESGFAWFVENLPGNYLTFPEHYIYNVALDVEALADTAERRRQFKKLFIERQISEGIDMPEVDQKTIDSFVKVGDLDQRIQRSMKLLELTNKYLSQTQNSIHAQRRALFELFHKEAPLKQAEMDEAYFRNRELVEADLTAALKHAKGDSLADLNTNNPPLATSIDTQSGKTLTLQTYLNRASAALFGAKSGAHGSAEILRTLLQILGCIKKYPQENKKGFISIDGTCYYTVSIWSRRFKEQGIRIADQTISRRLHKAGKIGKDGRDRTGRTLIGAYFSEEDVREVCSDYFITIEETQDQARQILIAIEETQDQARQILASKNVIDRQSLIRFGSDKFRRADFPPFGKGAAFAGAILGRTMRSIKTDDLHRIADILGFPKAKLEELKALLVAHGITDRLSLMQFSPKQFAKTDFPPYGKGKAFTVAILGKTVRNVTVPHLHRIADALGLSEINPEELKSQYIQILADKGITDRHTLMAFGSVKFRRADFPPFGKGIAFAHAILGKPVIVRLETLEEIADELNFPKLTPNEPKSIQHYRQALEDNGISDRFSIINFRLHKFMSTSFHPFGKGRAFAGLILDGKFKYVSLEHLSQIADKLNLPQLSEGNKQLCLQVLASLGITNSETLIGYGTHNFKIASFLPFGKAHAFVNAVLGEPVRNISRVHLQRMADVLFEGEK